MTALIRKQVVAVIDDRTTMVCLHAAGMITEVGEPFETLAGDFMEPPFHIHCRSIMRPWMSGFLSTTRKAANEEMKKRPMSQRRLGPDGEIGSRVPPAYDWNKPVDYTFPGSREASYYPAETGVEFATGRGLETNVPQPNPKIPDWKVLSARISQDVLNTIVAKMEELLFSQDEVEDVWDQLLEWVVEHVVKTVADLPAKLKRLLGL